MSGDRKIGPDSDSPAAVGFRTQHRGDVPGKGDGLHSGCPQHGSCHVLLVGTAGLRADGHPIPSDIGHVDTHVQLDAQPL